MKKVIAITGGYASGKSALLRFASNLGYATISCDEISRSLQEDKAYLQKLKKYFGKQIFEGEKLCKNRLADLVFSDKLLLKTLNDISHKEIEKRLWKQVEACRENIIFAEVPLLFETGMQNKFFCSILVTAEYATRIERAKKRYTISSSKILRIMENQMPDAEKIALCDYCIDNNGDMIELQQNFERVIGRILE